MKNILVSFKTNRGLRKELRERDSALFNAKVEAGYWKNRAEQAEQRLQEAPAWDTLGKAVGIPGSILSGGFDLVIAYLKGRIR
jgi:hypothetical protein